MLEPNTSLLGYPGHDMAKSTMSAVATTEKPPRMVRSHIERRIEVEGISVRYIEGGMWNPGPPLIMLHGFQTGADIWYPHTFPALAAERHVIAPDLPGFAYSGSLRPCTAESYAHFMNAFLDALGLPQIDLLGHSMGGLIAIATAAERPSRVHRLVLVSSAGLPHTGTRGLVSPFLLLDKSAYHFRLYLRLLRLSMRVRSGRGCLRMIRDDSVFGLLTDLTMPTLVIWGSRDRIIPLEHATIFARTIPDARLYIMQGCGHMPFYQKHRQFEKLVLHFLTK
jgi:pimeloyl-ACP methyl ester carboxylesterase